MTRSRSETITVVLRDDGGPHEELADVDRAPTRGEWSCRVTWTFTSARATPTGVELIAPEGAHVGPSQWRWVRVAEVIEHTRAHLELAALLVNLTEEGAPAAGLLAALGNKGSRKGLPDEHYEWVAGVYREAVAMTNPFPVRHVRSAALRAGWGDRATDAAVRGWVRECKRRGLITQTARPSRAITRKANQ